MLPRDVGQTEGMGALGEAFKALRQRWPTAWPGLPRVLDGALQWLGEGPPAAADAAAHRVMRMVVEAARIVEREGARQAAQGHEPAYHNRLHIADTLVSLVVLLQSRRQALGITNRRLQREEALCLLAMTIHDFGHDGRINAQAGDMERCSLQAFLPHARRIGVSLEEWTILSRLVLHTDPASVGRLHHEYRTAMAQGSEDWDWREMAALVTEADVLASALPEPGQSLGQALMREWGPRYPGRAARLTTPEGRLGFLAFGAHFSTPAAHRLGIPAAVQGQVLELTMLLQQGQRQQARQLRAEPSAR